MQPLGIAVVAVLAASSPGDELCGVVWLDEAHVSAYYQACTHVVYACLL
jgi:hypothetical protein